MKPNRKNPILLASLTFALTLATPSAFAADLYWDSDGDTAGFGSTTGTWGTDAFWTTVAGGAATHTAVTNLTTADIANFGTATLNYDNATVGVAAGGVTATRIVFGAGQTTALTLGTAGGGAITLGGDTRTILMNTSSTNTAAHTINAPIILTGATTVRVGQIGSAATRQLALGAMSGTGGVTLEYAGGNNGLGLILLNGASTYTGTTLIRASTSTTIKDANAEVRLGVNDALPTTTVLTLGGADGAGSGRTTSLNLNGNNQTLAGLVTSGGGSLRTFNIFSSTAATLTIDGTTSNIFAGRIGNGGTNISLVKAGIGTQTLSGANTYAGTTTISQGILQIGNGGTTGTLGDNSSTSIASGAELRINRSTDSFGYSYSGALSGSGTVNVLASRRINFDSNQTSSGNLSFLVDGVLGINTLAGITSVQLGELTGSGQIQRFGNAGGAATLVIGGKGTSTSYSGTIVSEELGLEKVGAGSLTLSGPNSFTGGVTIDAGNLTLANAGALNSTAGSENAVAFGASSTGTLALGGNSVVIRSLDSNATPGTPVVENANAGNATLTVGNSLNLASTYAGTIQDGSGGGTLALTKAGTNTLTLSGANSYTGATDVNAGTLLVDGSIASGSAVTVGTNGTLGGTGTIHGTLAVTGVLSPGTGLGDKQTLDAGTTTWTGGSIWNFDLSSTDDTSDKLAINGAFTKGTGSGFKFDFMGSTPKWAETYTLVTFGSTTFTSELDFDLAGSLATLGAGSYSTSSFTLNATSLTFTAVPEPTSALAGLLLGAGLLRRRRKC